MCVCSVFPAGLAAYHLVLLQVCPPQQMQELSVLLFCPLHHLHVPLFTPELLLSVDLCLEGQLQETESLSPVQ